jgi:hypothetical protein
MSAYKAMHTTMMTAMPDAVIFNAFLEFTVDASLYLCLPIICAYRLSVPTND